MARKNYSLDSGASERLKSKMDRAKFDMKMNMDKIKANEKRAKKAKDAIDNAKSGKTINKTFSKGLAEAERKNQNNWTNARMSDKQETSKISSYAKKKGIHDYNEAKSRYYKGVRQVGKSLANTQTLQSKSAGTLDNGLGNATLKRPTQTKTVVDAKTKKSMEREIKRTDRKAQRAQNAYARTTSNKRAAKMRAKRDNLRAQSSSLKGAYANIAKKGGKLCKKKC